MTALTFYGGVNEIGGNKILLEDSGGSLFLDFGFPYARYKQFYEEYLSPRTGAGLLDLLAMDMTPPLKGLYREDLMEPGLLDRLSGHPSYREISDLQGILLTHAHLDHSGYISYIRGDVPVYSTSTTALLTKAIQDSGKSGTDQQICYYTPAVYDNPSGWRQKAYTSDKKASAEQRRFYLGDTLPESLSPDSVRFWEYGFWEKTSRQKTMNPQPLMSHEACAFNIKCFPVDHSIPGACAWAIETSSGWVVYSGDLRLHGKRVDLTENFIREARALNPATLILEGTNIERDSNISEQDVYDNGLRAISGAHGLVIADFSPRDIDRLLTFLRIARETGRKLVVQPKDAYLLKTLRLLNDDIPDISSDNSIFIYQKTTGGPSVWMRNLCDEYAGKTLLAEDIGIAQDNYILCFSFFDLNELPGIGPAEGSLYVFSSSEPHDEEQEIDFRRLHEWLKYFSFRSVGLPVENDGKWEIPDGERGLHASGHACGADLAGIVNEINPGILVPVHSLNPGLFNERLESNGIRVILPEPGGKIEI